MQNVRLHGNSDNAHHIYSTQRTQRRSRPVWWGEDGPPRSSYNSHLLPEASVFGQIVGEYVTPTVRYWELSCPLFENVNNTSTRIREIFEQQMQHLAQFTHEVQQTKFEGPHRMDAVSGVTFKVHISNDEAGNMLGRTVFADIELIAIQMTTRAQLQATKSMTAKSSTNSSTTTAKWTNYKRTGKSLHVLVQPALVDFYVTPYMSKRTLTSAANVVVLRAKL
ncbi:hypothetical protein C8R43DRAFT_940798 [Mycena crocata]|nr:hypothetical protein C8R43DRAFT_940798 [Mycena crocata]